MGMFQYTVDKTLLPGQLAAVFVESYEDKETLEFLDDCRRNPHTRPQLLLARLLSLALPDYEVHGLLGLYPMHLLSAAQWLQLAGGPKQKLLDIGAGQGFVTFKAKNTFKEISVTETSQSMLKILQKHGFIIYKKNLSLPLPEAEEKFDVISILNVLDRCDFPLTMLDNAVSLLKPDGLLIIATPLPLKPYVRDVGGKRDQRQALPTMADPGWERQLNFFSEKILRPARLEITRFTRLPYIWKNGQPECFSYLDDAVMVCKKQPIDQSQVLE